MEEEIPLLGGAKWVAAAEIEDGGEPLPNPFDGFLPPICKGRPVLLGGAPESGKTVLGLQYYRTILDYGLSGVYITLEMSPKDLFERLKNQFEDEEDCKDWIKNNNAAVTESYVDPKEIEQLLKGEYDFVVIDHAHELPYDTREQLNKFIQRFMGTAIAHNVGLLFMAQLRRPNPELPRPPIMQDFKETGKFEEKAPIILALYKEDPFSDYCMIYNLKNRFGKKYDPIEVKLNREMVIYERV